MNQLHGYRSLISQILVSQPLAVLATIQGGQPFSSLIAFAVTDDLKNVLFITNKNTRKYQNIKENKKVAVLIDSRKNVTSDFVDAVAITALGIAQEKTGEERGNLEKSYLAKHPLLANFLNTPENALISVVVSSYIIAGFNKSEQINILG